MLNPNPQTTYLNDYAPPPFLISNVTLDIDIRDSETHVSSSLTVKRNPESSDSNAPLVLNGDELKLLSVSIDGRSLADTEFQCSPSHLRIENLPDEFRLDTQVRILPDENTQLMGLYRSKDGYFTQCEAEGFRRITYFLDRPDVMSRYTTTIRASKERFPLLLSNGNLDEQGSMPQGRHWARWVDPFPKPSYLFAMVAAKLDELENDFKTCSGRAVKLRLFVEPGKLDQAGFAVEALKAAMRWDEQEFGLELDLDQYMIVAVSDFNMGAMENKGLNIFNTKYVLARADTATDSDFMMLDRVVAHEYFHNWTGNRVTCRDWFQLSLKEGLTVFRDQRYGEDRYSQAVQRIQEVRGLRASQFPEDASPMAHPVRPDAYIEISNFYTATIYNKGAEVVRMIHTLLGPRQFRAGMDLYFERHDGQAVCVEDFASAMEDASGINLEQFQRWYRQAGTPVVTARSNYDEKTRRFTLHLTQSCPPTPGQDTKLPFHIPIAIGLIDDDGNDLPLNTDDQALNNRTTEVLSLTEYEQEFTFENIAAKPTPSLLRHFSAPINLVFDYGDDELAHLMAHDSDPFNRWEAGQRLALNVLLRGIADYRRKRELNFAPAYLDAIKRVLQDSGKDPAFAAEAISIPAAGYIAEQLAEADPDAIFAVRSALRRHIAEQLETNLQNAYRDNVVTGPYSPDAASAGGRALRNTCLSLLMESKNQRVIEQCTRQFNNADNMTDSIAALASLANCDCTERRDALDTFYTRWREEPLVLDKWFSVQAGSVLPNALEETNKLMRHADFDLTNPNRVRAVIGVFCHGNHLHFNAADGSGYQFAAAQVIALDPINPQIAARLARAFDRWKKFDVERQTHARAALEQIKALPALSKDTFEVVSSTLA
ncbi:MAG: aminopeptidase N [Gammaproteobacteria bacterium]|jgi:aminopeptidase N